MSDLANYEIRSTDWRRQIRRNQRRSRWIIFTFVLIYVVLGFLIDLLLNSTWYYGATYTAIAQALLTFQLIPYATISMGVIAIIALWITYALYDRVMLMGTQSKKITEETISDEQEQQLFNVVDEMKVAAGLRYRPKIFIIEAGYMNAFASGYSEKSAMVAITRGLLEKLDRSELTAVMAHELSHIRHLDIKLTLTASVLANIMLIAVDLIFYNILFGNRRRMDERLLIFVIILRYILPLITVLLTLYLSRTREFMADAGCVELMRDNQPLARALIKIHQDHQQNRDYYRQEYGNTAHEDVRRSAYLYDPVKSGIEPVHSFTSLFSTHPSLKARLAAIGVKTKTEK